VGKKRKEQILTVDEPRQDPSRQKLLPMPDQEKIEYGPPFEWISFRWGEKRRITLKISR
jgi:hypothetical protein